MNVGEYGVAFRLGTGFNLAAATQLSFTFTKPDGTVLNVPGTLGTLTIVTPAGTFPANTWAEYIFTAGEVVQVGQWFARLIYEAPAVKLISDTVTFEVTP